MNVKIDSINIEGIIVEISEMEISTDRKKILKKIRDQLRLYTGGNKRLSLIFICTHNSRRSQFAQFWAQVIGHYFGYDHLQVLSGGTEITEVYPSVMQALEWEGFQFSVAQNVDQKQYDLVTKENQPSLHLYSKLYQDNPINKDTIAITTCGDAEESCPYIPNISGKYFLPFRDPKYSDGTEDELQTYKNTSRLIASELFYILKK